MAPKRASSESRASGSAATGKKQKKQPVVNRASSPDQELNSEEELELHMLQNREKTLGKAGAQGAPESPLVLSSSEEEDEDSDMDDAPSPAQKENHEKKDREWNGVRTRRKRAEEGAGLSDEEVNAGAGELSEDELDEATERINRRLSKKGKEKQEKVARAAKSAPKPRSSTAKGKGKAVSARESSSEDDGDEDADAALRAAARDVAFKPTISLSVWLPKYSDPAPAPAASVKPPRNPTTALNKGEPAPKPPTFSKVDLSLPPGKIGFNFDLNISAARFMILNTLKTAAGFEGDDLGSDSESVLAFDEAQIKLRRAARYVISREGSTQPVALHGFVKGTSMGASNRRLIKTTEDLLDVGGLAVEKQKEESVTLVFEESRDRAKAVEDTATSTGNRGPAPAPKELSEAVQRRDTLATIMKELERRHPSREGYYSHEGRTPTYVDPLRPENCIVVELMVLRAWAPTILAAATDEEKEERYANPPLDHPDIKAAWRTRTGKKLGVEEKINPGLLVAQSLEVNTKALTAILDRLVPEPAAAAPRQRSPSPARQQPTTLSSPTKRGRYEDLSSFVDFAFERAPVGTSEAVKTALADAGFYDTTTVAEQGYERLLQQLENVKAGQVATLTGSVLDRWKKACLR